MNAQDRYNSERYPDMTCFLALRNIERNERKERRNRMKENWIYRRGDVYLANLDPYIGSEQGGIRPVLIVQNDVGNRHSPTVIAAAITSQREKAKLPTHIEVHADKCGLSKDSVVLLEQIRTIDKKRLKERMGELDTPSMNRVDNALSISFGLGSGGAT